MRVTVDGMYDGCSVLNVIGSDKDVHVLVFSDCKCYSTDYYVYVPYRSSRAITVSAMLHAKLQIERFPINT